MPNMTLSMLSRKCKECPKLDTCKEKRMELCMFKMEEPIAMPATMGHTISLAQPMIRDTSIHTEISEKIIEKINRRIAESLYMQCKFIGR